MGFNKLFFDVQIILKHVLNNIKCLKNVSLIHTFYEVLNYLILSVDTLMVLVRLIKILQGVQIWNSKPTKFYRINNLMIFKNNSKFLQLKNSQGGISSNWWIVSSCINYFTAWIVPQTHWHNFFAVIGSKIAKNYNKQIY